MTIEIGSKEARAVIEADKKLARDAAVRAEHKQYVVYQVSLYEPDDDPEFDEETAAIAAALSASVDDHVYQVYDQYAETVSALVWQSVVYYP